MLQLFVSCFTFKYNDSDAIKEIGTKQFGKKRLLKIIHPFIVPLEIQKIIFNIKVSALCCYHFILGTYHVCKSLSYTTPSNHKWHIVLEKKCFVSSDVLLLLHLK